MLIQVRFLGFGTRLTHVLFAENSVDLGFSWIGLVDLLINTSTAKVSVVRTHQQRGTSSRIFVSISHGALIKWHMIGGILMLCR